MPMFDGPLTGAPLNFPTDRGGGGGPPLQTRTFDDDQTIDLVVGSAATDACLAIDLALSNELGAVTCYRLTFAVSATGIEMDCPQTDSDVPVDTVLPLPVIVGGQAVLRLVGSGPGTPTLAAYRVEDSLPRLPSP